MIRPVREGMIPGNHSASEANLRYGRLRVTTPNGQVREHGLDVPAVTIGRAAENAVVVDDISVSRRHARVTIDSGMPLIEDLGSDNGTYIGSQRLTPGERHMFANTGVRLGAVEIAYLAPEGAPPPGGGVHPAAVPGSAGAAAAGAPPAQPVVVTLRGPAAPVSAGGVSTATVQIQNRGSTVDELSIAVVDLPEGWAEINRPSVSLLPGAREEVTIMLKPPRSAAATAGEHAFSVAVTSRSTGAEIRAVGVLSVERFAGFGMGIQPVRSDGNFTLTLENTGNAPLALAMRAQDDEGRLEFTFDTLNVDLPAGERKAVRLRAKLPGAPKFGRESIRAFTVEARQQGGGNEQASAAGQLRIKPPLQALKLPVIALLVIAALATGGVTYAKKCESWELPGCRDSGAIPATGGDQTPTNASPTAGGSGGALPTMPGGGVATPTPSGSGAGTPTQTGGATAPPTSPTTAGTTSPTTGSPTVGSPTTAATATPAKPTFPKADQVLDPKKDYLAVVVTTAGQFTIDLDLAKAPNTSNSFAFLAQKGFYDGMQFEGGPTAFQTGDGDGKGTAGYTQSAELTGVKNTRGTVGMIPIARDAGKVGSEWYVNLQDNAAFDATSRIAGAVRPVFGTVTVGMDVVDKLSTKDEIKGITIQEKTLRPLPFPTILRLPTVGPLLP